MYALLTSCKQQQNSTYPNALRQAVIFNTHVIHWIKWW